MRFGGMDLSTNLDLLEKILLPILTYGAELTTPNLTSLRKATSAVAMAAKHILGLHWNANSKWSLWEAGIPSIQAQIEEKKLRLAMKLNKQHIGSRYIDLFRSTV